MVLICANIQLSICLTCAFRSSKMKRKKQAEDPSTGEENALQRNSRSGNGAGPTSGEPHELDGIQVVSSGRKHRKININEDDLESAPIQELHQPNNGLKDDRPRQTSEGRDEGEDGELQDVTPMQKGLKGPLGSVSKAESNGFPPTKDNHLFSTPNKAKGMMIGSPRLERHADRSARRKSTRKIIEQTVLGTISDNDEDDEDLAQHIYGSESEDDEPRQDLPEENGDTVSSVPPTPSKRGRKKGSRNRKRSPTPQGLPPHELYFSQNRGGRPKTSNNNLSSLELLDHEEYFNLARAYEAPHAVDLESLQQVHAGSFKQWEFELSQEFNICLYGWGSKRSLLMKFAEHIYMSQIGHGDKIVVVNGYVHNLTIRDILNTVAAAASDKGTKLGSQPGEMLENLITILEEDENRHITMMIHSIDGTSLRRPSTQTILARLSSHSQIHLVASADHPSFSLLWDSSLRSNFNFLFHDCTTFQPFRTELDVVDDVHELFGRSGRRVGGKEGVSFVLKSLPENAKSLFRVLVGEQLAIMDESVGFEFGEADDDHDDDTEQRSRSRRIEAGVEYRVLYQKAVEEFICSNEMNFRTLLKE